MRRRDFLSTGAALIASAGLTSKTNAQAQSSVNASSGGRQGIEIRTYHFASPEKQNAYAEFLSNVGIAAMKRAGCGPIGVFRELAADNPKLKLSADSTDLWVIIGHDSADSVLEMEPKLGADTAYQNAGKEILQSPKNDPAFTHYDTELLIAFDNFPRMVPRELNESRVLELRTYESRNQERAANKVAMFNNGEIGAFEPVGMPGIFWGSAIAGTNLPHLTYMVYHKSIEQAAKDWKAFGASEIWNRMRAEPQYKDNVSKVVNRFLRPVKGSEI